MTHAPDFRLGHVEFYVADLAAASAELTDHYGFRPVARAATAEADSLALRQGRITLVLTQARTDDHPAARYVRAHGDGVADIALTVTDVFVAFGAAVARGAVAVAPPYRHADGRTTAVIEGFGDVVHTLTEAGGDFAVPPGFTPVEDADAAGAGELLTELDHFAICIEAGELDRTVEHYTRVLGFRTIFTELIRVGAQAMESQVVQSASGEITLTLIQPDATAEPGQINRFLERHGGPGVQHLAFTATDIVEAVGTLQKRGVDFLTAPEAYYTLLAGHLDLTRHTIAGLRELNVLVDEDQDGQLFQIFTRSTHPDSTLFYEVIERFGARTFGSGNIKALYEAVEAERLASEGVSL
ncbi:4-hydroxyphenylpyruvate dioxygenase [Umezawaea tangerina]|uniref:4-hydroxymandelate synthase n=1 Tax=Umezawaea tangerina TaxID=84725 RepID=A0A2T0T7M6_9PSEU|nr:4-hydroxyphenylpyruvate dioxygenase [Umezawaea tangerina]PRY41648.1 4-hydroxymandelate synthase [Umezawaea tangerina]